MQPANTPGGYTRLDLLIWLSLRLLGELPSKNLDLGLGHSQGMEETERERETGTK